jgi:anti-anti-sigma factor
MCDNAIHQLVVDELDARVVVAIVGEVDQSNAESIEFDLRTAADGRLLVVDLRSTTYFDSAGVAMLHNLRQDREFALLIEPDSIVRRVVEITGLDQLVPVLRSP